MSITLEFTYEMSKVLGVSRLDVPDVPTIGDAVAIARTHFAEKAAEQGPEVFDRLARVAALAVNGVLVKHRQGLRTKLSAGDRIGFVKAAAGG